MPAGPARDTLWLGVHKTGTTFLQKSLDLSLPELLGAGIDYLPLEVFRARYTRPLLHDTCTDAPGPGGPGHPGRRRLVFDENIPALVQHAATPEGLYPRIGPRARQVADHLGMTAPRIVLGLRGFHGFLPSLYCEALKSTRFRPFRDFQKVPHEALSWLPVLDALRESFPDSALWVYDAAVLRGAERQLLSWVTGLPETSFTLLAGPERPGFSHRAVMALEALAQTRAVEPADVRQLVAAHPRGPETPGFDPWSAEETRALEGAYAADLARIRARPDIRMLDLSPSPDASDDNAPLS